MKKIPAIAQQRHQEATAKLTHKLDTLELLLTKGTLEQFPMRTSVSSFAAWGDLTLGVQPLSRSVIYDESDEYLVLRRRMEHLLDLVAKARAKKNKKNNIEAELRRKLALAEERSHAYVNQYSIAMAELAEARKEIERLNHKLHRQTTNEARVTPLRIAKTPTTAE